MSASPEARLVARARALATTSTTPPVFSHETAAALHGLPLYRSSKERVHVIVAHERPGAASGVIRHRGELRDEDVTEVDGLRCTRLPRTVADMARTATFEQAVTVADAALRRRCAAPHGTYDDQRAAWFREEVLAIARRSPHGRTRAERVLAFADGRAELPGETISRIRLASLGFRRPRLQVPVRAPGTGWYYVDFGLDDADAFGEFDGAIKYLDGRMLDGRTAADVFDREKQREDWIRGSTQRRFVRWGWPHLECADTLRVRLASFGVLPPR